MPATYDTEWSCDLFKVDAAKQRELIGTETVITEGVPPFITAQFNRTFFPSRIFDDAECKLVSQKRAQR
jgi:hypothetical protein